jgi:DNA-binding HxlR family transcriptional regulator
MKDASIDNQPSSVCPPHDFLGRLGDKWTMQVLVSLARAPGARLRFSHLKKGVAGISQRMLTVTLRTLERDGLVQRHFFPEVPPRVEYELTSIGKSILPALEGFVDWVRTHWPLVERSRTAFDFYLSNSEK